MGNCALTELTVVGDAHMVFALTVVHQINTAVAIVIAVFTFIQDGISGLAFVFVVSWPGCSTAIVTDLGIAMSQR